MNRNRSQSISSNAVKKLKPEDIADMLDDEFLVLSAQSNISVIRFLAERTKVIEKKILEVAKPLPSFQKLMGVPGIGKILGLTIALETGDINRFKSAGKYASYCRCVKSHLESNGKKKGENNRKNGNKYLAWAFVEAANFSRRYCTKSLAFYNKKLAKRNKNVATKALACKICKACYHVLKNNIDYSSDRVFG
jgi:transposase